MQRLLKSDTHKAPPALLAAEIEILTSNPSLHDSLPFVKDIIQLASKYTSLPGGKTSAKVWLARLEAEKAFGDESELEKSCTEARALVQGSDVVSLWLWTVDTHHVQDEESALQRLVVLEVGLIRRITRRALTYFVR